MKNLSALAGGSVPTPQFCNVVGVAYQPRKYKPGYMHIMVALGGIALSTVVDQATRLF